MKPSKEQIEAWVAQVRPWMPAQPDDTNLAKLAYAAGRKAGMEEAQWACKRVAVRGAGTQRGRGAQDCIDEIDAAMEADK